MDLVESSWKKSIDSLEIQMAEDSLSDLSKNFRSSLNAMTKEINDEITRLSTMNLNNIGKTLGFDNLNFILRECVEPNIVLKEKIAIYMNKVDLLKYYYNTFGDFRDQPTSLVEFELSKRFAVWQRSYKQLYDHIASSYFTSSQRHLQAQILIMMNM
jgi:hypothetical protein